MINNRSWLKGMFNCLLSSALVGCAYSNYLERQQYLLDQQKKLTSKAPKLKKCEVFIDSITAIPPFDQLDFIYRIEPNQYLLDYYHGFFIAPSVQIKSILQDYLAAAGNFKLNVIEPAAAFNKLQVKLTELDADYRDRNHPQGVIACHFLLTKIVDGQEIVLWDQLLSSKVILKNKDTDSLLRAWNLGIRTVLQQAVRILNSKISCSK